VRRGPGDEGVQEIEDEAHEQILERVCAIDMAKASGMVCMRVPHPSRPGQWRTRAWEVDATSNAILEFGASGQRIWRRHGTLALILSRERWAIDAGSAVRGVIQGLRKTSCVPILRQMTCGSPGRCGRP
jgi:hypothetical protein